MNSWKKAFLFLLGVNVLVILILLWLVFIPSAKDRTVLPQEVAGDHVSFFVKTNKKDLTQLINHYLKKEAAGSPMDYRIQLGNEVEFYGTLPFLGEAINMKLTFEPEALSNGDLLLRQNSLSIGSLNLPVPYVLDFIKKNYNLPGGVDIEPNDRLIYIHMQQIKTKSDMKLKVNAFDLKKDHITFTILVPTK